MRSAKKRSTRSVFPTVTIITPRSFPAASSSVAIARAIATNPEIIFFDEPTSALDPELTGEVLSVMRDLANEGMTMLVVTHEMGCRTVSNKVIFMEDGVIVRARLLERIFREPEGGTHKSVPAHHSGETWIDFCQSVIHIYPA